jgi:long-subunit acyl-CoA synthetase (AMP-forming)
MKRKGLGDKLIELAKGVLSTSLAAVFYEFNSHGDMKKKEITHQEVAEAIRSSSERLSFIGEEDQAFSHLPSVSSFERFVNYMGIYVGIRIVVAETRDDFFDDILEVKPTVIFETKDGLEYVSSKILSNSQKNSPIQKLRSSLGGRIKYIITDLPAKEEIRNLFSKSGVSLVEVPELAHLLA